MAKSSCLLATPVRVVVTATPTRKNVNEFVAAVKALWAVQISLTRVVMDSRRVRAHQQTVDPAMGRATAAPLIGSRATATKPAASAIPIARPVRVRPRVATPTRHRSTGQPVRVRLRAVPTLTGAAPATTQATAPVVVIGRVVAMPATMPIAVAVMPTGVAVGKPLHKLMLKSRFSKPTPGWRVTHPTGVPTAVVIAEASAKKTAG